MKELLIVCIISCFFAVGENGYSQETPQEKNERMAWFKDARLGIFIHWGIYAVNGIDESWSFFNGYISYNDYMKQLDGFTAKNYDPGNWASLIKESGAKYAVITSKHHDGVALWDTKLSDLNVVDKTPAGRDLLSPFVKALRKNDLKVGIYYSVLDWSHPDYPNFTKKEKRYTDDPERQARFTEFNHGQIDEISRKFKPDLYWFDGDWEQSAEWWKAAAIRQKIIEQNDRAIINSRLQGYGDYATPEQGLPLRRPAEKYWELCMTINDSWGYQHNDLNYKSPGQLIRIFAECLSMGGNMLLDIGPREDGSIPEEQVTVLKEMGRWTSKHSEAIYGTEAGLPDGFYHGPSTISADSTMLYLFVPGTPAGNQLMLEGVKNKINRIYVVGNGTKLEHKEYLKPYWSNHSGVIFIDLPEHLLDSRMSVVALVLDGKLKVE
ncbi:MAG: alpha-L-fucosidase [Marinilabiliaceae bacterium]|jgi:alpha-L-fucosidase|nr:alpha-L-fucosidase [Marinilabiliaceae bacterium]